MITILGIDPDSEAHGVAIYTDGKLSQLRTMQLIDFFVLDAEIKIDEVHMENVCAQNQTFQKKGIHNLAAAKNVARSVGMCQQAQIELERVFEHLGIKVVKHPISKNWKPAKTGKPMFEKVTGWTGKSNEDTRSAAYFGYLGVREWHAKHNKNK